jgi:HPr kinase/phosphorylase
MSTTLTIATLRKALQEKMGLEWITGEQYAEKTINAALNASADVALVGHLNLINPHHQLFSGQSDLVIITKSLPAPDDLVTAAETSKTPLLSSNLPSQETIQNIQYYTSTYFARKVTLHGVFMEVMGTGVLITGDSSIGKSELALELLTRGHRLIADDAPEFSRLAPDTVSGTCPDMLRDFLEVRGLGILNVRAMFGASSIKPNRNLRLIVVLQDMEDAIKMDRLHGSKQMRSILDVDIPEVTLPVGPGRNLAVLLETAVRNHILNTKGYDASQAFIERQKRRLEKAHR